MSTTPHSDVVRHWQEIVGGFVKLGVTAYGGPAIMGLMQAELQEKRQWVTRERFVEGLSLVNMLPGAGATQLGIFLGHARGGWWGGLLAGLCFVLPAFGIMLALTMTYAHLGATPLMRGGLYGLGPVVLGIFAVAVVSSRQVHGDHRAPAPDCHDRGSRCGLESPGHCHDSGPRGGGRHLAVSCAPGRRSAPHGAHRSGRSCTWPWGPRPSSGHRRRMPTRWHTLQASLTLGSSFSRWAR